MIMKGKLLKSKIDYTKNYYAYVYTSCTREKHIYFLG